MTQTQRPSTSYWIDHYVVGSDDLDRWADFHTKLIGSKMQPGQAPGNRRFIVFLDITPCCHHGATLSPDPLPPSAGLGKGLPRHGLFIRKEDIEYHLRRLDELKVPHLDPARSSAEGEEGVAIAWEDPDHNQFEFWAPDRLPAGAMVGATAFRIGRISHGVYESLDLQRAADHFSKFCALEPLKNADVAADTLVLPLVGGARVVYKKVDSYGQRTGGWGKLPAAHAALVIKDEDFFRNYDYMWDNVPEWEYDREKRGFVGAGADLPARTSRHGSPGGVMWFEVKGRGDDWYDWDTNSFHFVGGTPKDATFTEYEPHTMDWHFPQYMEAHGLPMPEMPERRRG